MNRNYKEHLRSKNILLRFSYENILNDAGMQFSFNRFILCN